MKMVVESAFVFKQIKWNIYCVFKVYTFSYPSKRFYWFSNPFKFTACAATHISTYKSLTQREVKFQGFFQVIYIDNGHYYMIAAAA